MQTGISNTQASSSDHYRLNAVSEAVKIALDLGDVCHQIAKKTSLLFFSYDVSFMFIAMVIFASLFAKIQAEVAATLLIATTANLLAGVSVAYLFAVAMWTAGKREELKAITDETRNLMAVSPAHGAIAKPTPEQLKTTISKVYSSGLFGSFPFLVAGVLVMLFSKPILTGLGQDPDVAQLASNFLQIYTGGLVALWLRESAEQILIAFGQQFAMMTIALSSFALSSFGAYFLRPEMGLEGVALAYTIGAAITATGVLAYLAKAKVFKDYSFFRQLPDKQIVKELFSLGWPLVISFINEFAVMFMLSIIAGWSGKDALVTQNVVSQLSNINFPLQYALAYATALLFAGAESKSDKSKYARIGAVFSMLLIAVVNAIFAARPDWLVRSIVPDPSGNTISISTTPVRIQAIADVLDALRTSMTFILRFSGYNKESTIISTLSMWASPLIAWVLSTYTDQGVNAMPTSYAVAVSFNILALFSQWFTRTSPEQVRARLESSASSSSILSLPSSSPLAGSSSAHVGIGPASGSDGAFVGSSIIIRLPASHLDNPDEEFAASTGVSKPNPIDGNTSPLLVPTPSQTPPLGGPPALVVASRSGRSGSLPTGITMVSLRPL